GPIAFFIQTPQIDPVDYITLYQSLYEINSTIASVSLTLIPGETALVSDRPSLASDVLLQNINYVPQKEIKDLYAEKFLQYKSIVEVEYSVNYIESDYLIQTVRDDSGLNFVHYLISPEKLSVSQYGSEYYARFVLNGSVTDLEGKLIYQFEKEYTIDLDEEKAQTIRQMPFQINDMFPLVPGNYRFSLLLKNSVSKEFSSFEETVIIPEESTSPEISALLFCYSSREMRGTQKAMRPFQIRNRLLFSQPGNTFQSSEKMTIFFQLYGLNYELMDGGKLEFSFHKGEEAVKSFSHDLKDYAHPTDILEEISLAEFPSADYTLKVTLQDQSGQVLAIRSQMFSISPISGFPRPYIQSKALPAVNDALNDFRIGSQLFNKGDIERAAIEFEKALSKKPGEMNFAISLAKTYFNLKRYEDIERVLTPFHRGEEAREYYVYYYLGQSAQARDEFAKAIGYYKEAISHFGLNIFLLNAIGECFFRLNNLPEARTAWEKSLEIKPDQPQIQEKLSKMKR
ncbi:MAG: tetratricopeptide repeat protein, partial [Candidatus Aminicenantes bacterium]|nr:tetratricopeptide repeat protein [Candidatus Aminicenantes bacterium]